MNLQLHQVVTEVTGVTRDEYHSRDRRRGRGPQVLAQMRDVPLQGQPCMGDQSIQSEVIPGVDTHPDTHVGAVITETGKLLGTFSVSTDSPDISSC
jgi:hypothetical protein